MLYLKIVAFSEVVFADFKRSLRQFLKKYFELKFGEGAAITAEG